MSRISKLVIYASEPELEKHAGSYPCLVNFDPFTKTGEVDDGCGHSARVTFVAVDPKSEVPSLPPGDFDNVELIGFPMPASFTQKK
jgi:hypothetical protein